MDYIKLGRTGLDVSPIAIGAMTYGEPGRGHPVWSLDEEASRPLIKHALESGINFFDTANLYSQGSSEEILGRALRDFADRDDVVIATKVRHPMRPGPNGKGLSRKAILTEIDHSLRRLGTDYVDLYQIHRLDQATPWRRRSKRCTISSRPARSATWARPRCTPGSSPRPCTSRNVTAGRASSRCRTTTTCSPARRGARCCRCAPTRASARSCGAPSRAAASRDRGARTRRARRPTGGTPTCSTASRTPTARSSRPSARSPGERGVSRAQIALAWLRAQPVVVAPLVGASRSTHIDDAVASLEIELTEDEIERLERPYTPRDDFQGVSDEAELQRLMARVPGFQIAAR